MTEEVNLNRTKNIPIDWGFGSLINKEDAVELTPKDSSVYIKAWEANHLRRTCG